MTYITRIANKRILAKYFLYSLKINYLHWKLSASRSIFSWYATYVRRIYVRTFQRIDSETVSHHYFHMFAVQDQADLSSASDLPRDGVIDVAKLIPTNSDHECMRKEFCVLISR